VLCVNLLIAAVIVWSTAATAEYWLHRRAEHRLRTRAKAAQFSLLSILVVTAAVAVMLAMARGVLSLRPHDVPTCPIYVAVACSLLTGVHRLLRARGRENGS
jgi:hypothetical protein